jgi:hypothetical protein
MLEQLRSLAYAASLKVYRAASTSAAGGTSGKAADEQAYARAWKRYCDYRRLNGEPGCMN